MKSEITPNKFGVWSYIPKVGDVLDLGWEGHPKICRVLEVRPYTGKYPDSFPCIVKHTSDVTQSGTIETAWANLNTFRLVVPENAEVK